MLASRLIQPITFGMLFGITQIVHANLTTNSSFESDVYVPPSNNTMPFSSHALNGTIEELLVATRKVGRDAGTGKFKPVKDAQKDKKGSVVETIKTPKKKK